MGIEVKNLTKKYDKKIVLDNISFSVEDGKISSLYITGNVSIAAKGTAYI